MRNVTCYESVRLATRTVGPAATSPAPEPTNWQPDVFRCDEFADWVMSDAPADRQVHRVVLGSGYGLLVVAAIITGALTVIGTLLAQHFGRLATGRDTEGHLPSRASS